MRRLALMTLVTGVMLASAGLGAWLAWNHPLWPGVLFAGFVAWGLAVACWPRLWFFVVPPALPLLNFSPWSGWLVFEEFDILLLGVLAGGYGRLAVLACGRGVRAQLDGPSRHQEERLAPPDWALGSLALCLAASGLLALWRGVADAGGWSFGWFDDAGVVLVIATGKWRKRQESNLPGALLRASLVLKTRHPNGDIALPLYLKSCSASLL